MPSLDGPHPISSKLQLRLPVAMARQLNINGGDEFFWRISDDEPGVLHLIPAEVIERRYAAGARLENLDREFAAELGQESREPGSRPPAP
ncbi:MAG: AbrB/MazE/SpoVT family DNA-binding domain-containing protein [Microbacterium sp.]|nr:AbrB/MazE/SpoVT family DNA-binding domain-containing protein [Microbacterium sp.]